MSRNCSSGSSRLRKRSTGVPWISSMRCSESSEARTSSSTLICGMAKRSPAHSTISAETMASVSGILIVKVEPLPISDLTSTVPPIFSMLVRTTSMPTPRPETLVTTLAVEKPARKTKRRACWSVISSSSASVVRPFSRAFSLTRLTSMPAPSSLISMMMWPPS